MACVNTSYSRKEEKQITCTLTQLIAGQFPAHSAAFYKHQVSLNSARLQADLLELTFTVTHVDHDGTVTVQSYR